MEEDKKQTWCISKIDIFENLSLKAKEKIASKAISKNFSKDQTIFTPYETKEKVYLVKKGEVEIYQLSIDGKKVIINLISKGGFFGNALLSSQTNDKIKDFAEAIKDSSLCIIPKSDFLKILEEMPEVAMNVIKDLSNKLNEADSRIRDLAIGNVSVRLLNELLRLAQKQGQETKNNIIINERHTHEELAEIVGASRETVTKILGKLKQKKIIEIDDQRRFVINKEKIEKIKEIL